MKHTAVPYYSKVDRRGRIHVSKAMREQMGLPNGGLIDMEINAEGHLVLWASAGDVLND